MSSWLIINPHSSERDSIIDFLLLLNEIFDVFGNKSITERPLIES